MDFLSNIMNGIVLTKQDNFPINHFKKNNPIFKVIVSTIVLVIIMLIILIWDTSSIIYIARNIHDNMDVFLILGLTLVVLCVVIIDIGIIYANIGYCINTIKGKYEAKGIITGLVAEKINSTAISVIDETYCNDSSIMSAVTEINKLIIHIIYYEASLAYDAYDSKSIIDNNARDCLYMTYLVDIYLDIANALKQVLLNNINKGDDTTHSVREDMNLNAFIHRYGKISNISEYKEIIADVDESLEYDSKEACQIRVIVEEIIDSIKEFDYVIISSKVIENITSTIFHKFMKRDFVELVKTTDYKGE